MLIHAAKRLMQEHCALRCLSLNTKKTYTHWLLRVVLFPDCLTPALQRQLEVAKAHATQDEARRILVALPGLLAKKYPYASHQQRWAWLFPSHTTCRDPRSMLQLRWRCHENNVQRAVRAAANRCHLEGLTPHCLRHAGLENR